MPDMSLFDVLDRLSSLTRMWFRQHPLLADLQPVQLSALMYLARCNRYSNTPLGVTDYLGLTKGTVSQSLKLLESKGLIVRKQDARDKRSVHLQLTESASTLLDALLPPTFWWRVKRRWVNARLYLRSYCLNFTWDQRTNNVRLWSLP